MNTFVQKKRENKSGGQPDGHSGRDSAARTASQHGEDRPEAVVQRALQQSLNQSPRVQTQLQLQKSLGGNAGVLAQAKLAENFSGRDGRAQSQQTIQRREALEEKEPQPVQRETVPVEEDPLQGKLQPAVRDGGSQSSPFQLMSFARFQGVSRLYNWFYSDPEEKLLKEEKRLGELLTDMRPYKETRFGDQIGEIENSYQAIKGSTYETGDYARISQTLTGLFYRLDGISVSLLAEERRFLNRYGDNNTDLMRLNQKRDRGEHAGALLRVILATIDRLPEPMQTPKNKELIKKAIHPDIHSLELNDQLIKDNDLKFASDRSRLMIDNLNELTERIRGDWKGLQEEFGLKGELKSIQLTGSDFHNRGQQVAIIESTGGTKAVYKPRSVMPDEGLVGDKGSAFAELNEMSDELQLPTMHFRERKGYAYAQYAEQKPTKSAPEIRQYYRRLGQTAVASKLLGVNDLHQENIMATPDRPTIIDAETSFLPYVMSARKFTATGIHDALTSFTSIQTTELENNHFVTPEEETAWQQMSPAEKKRRKFTTYGDYITDRRRNDLSGEQNYLTYFREGLNQVLKVIKSKPKEIMEVVLNKMKGMQMVRVVPFDTMTFTGGIRDYHDWIREGEEKRALQILEGRAAQAAEALKMKGFELSGEAPDIIRRLMKADFDMRDTPIFHFHPKDNALTYHDKIIGRSEELKNPEKLVGEQVEWLAALTPEDVLGSLGLGE